MPDLAGSIGLWMLTAALVALLASVFAVLPQLLRVRRGAGALEATVSKARFEIDAQLIQLTAGRAEMERLWRPWRRLFRWTTHPLTIALIRSCCGR
jgi:hypothetical protein